MPFLSDLLGSKPVVPTLPSLDLSTEQQKALAANLAAIPGAEQIAGKVDLFNQQQIDQMLSHVIPNYQAITGQISQNIQSLTAGQIPTDVSQAVQQSAAAQALGGGYGGTGAGRNLLARDLGLTSLDLTQRGLASAESWMRAASSIYEPGMFNVTSMFITPMQQYQTANEQNVQQFQRQWMQNQITAMPAMWAQDLKEAVETAASMYGGSGPTQSAGTLPAGVSAGFEGGGGNFSGGFGGYGGGGLNMGGGGEGGTAIGLDTGGGGAGFGMGML